MFSDEQLLLLKSYVKDLDHEVCGNISIDNNGIYSILNVVNGKFYNGRKQCITNKIHKVNFHTHPANEKSFPSAEDIISTVKQRDISVGMREFIFTKWGIWDIVARKRIYMNPTLQKELVDKLYTRILNKFYIRTCRGRADYVNDNEFTAFIKAIKEFLYSKGIHCDIFFTRWNLG